MTHLIRLFINCAYFVVSFNYLEGWCELFFMYQLFFMNQQATCRKSAMPYDYPPHVANSSWLLYTEAKLWLIPNTISKCKAYNSLQRESASMQFKKSSTQNRRHTQIDMH